MRSCRTKPTLSTRGYRCARRQLRGFHPRKSGRCLRNSCERRRHNRNHSYPLSDNQRGIWFLSEFAPESSIYNVSFAGRIRSEMDIPAFRRAFQALLDRHPSLRTTFAVRSGTPVQQIHEHESVHFEEIDASSWDEDELHRRLDEQTQRPFDLERGPVMRVTLFTRSEQRTRPVAGHSSHRGRFLVARGDPE